MSKDRNEAEKTALCKLLINLLLPPHGQFAQLRGHWANSGPKRFGDLKRLVTGISEKVLIQQLRELAVVGVLVRHDYQRVPPMVDYTMTPFGITLVQALMPLCKWGNEHRAQVEEIILARSSKQETRAG